MLSYILPFYKIYFDFVDLSPCYFSRKPQLPELQPSPEVLACCPGVQGWVGDAWHLSSLESPLPSNGRVGGKGTEKNIFSIEGQIPSLETSNLGMHTCNTCCSVVPHCYRQLGRLKKRYHVVSLKYCPMCGYSDMAVAWPRFSPGPHACSQPCCTGASEAAST